MPEKVTEERIWKASRADLTLGYAYGGRVVHAWLNVSVWAQAYGPLCTTDGVANPERDFAVGDRMCKACAEKLDGKE